MDGLEQAPVFDIADPAQAQEAQNAFALLGRRPSAGGLPAFGITVENIEVCSNPDILADLWQIYGKRELAPEESAAYRAIMQDVLGVIAPEGHSLESVLKFGTGEHNQYGESQLYFKKRVPADSNKPVNIRDKDPDFVYTDALTLNPIAPIFGMNLTVVGEGLMLASSAIETLDPTVEFGNRYMTHYINLRPGIVTIRVRQGFQAGPDTVRTTSHKYTTTTECRKYIPSQFTFSGIEEFTPRQR